MKKRLLGFVVICLLVLVACSKTTTTKSSRQSAHSQTSSKKVTFGKTAVIYYSLTGNTKKIAEMIHKQVGGDLIVLQTVKPYSKNYDTATNQVKKQVNTKQLPKLRALSVDWTKYDTVFIGSPIWYGDLSLPVQSFLRDAELPKNVHIVPFFTSGSSKPATALATEKRLMPQHEFNRELGVTNDQQANASALVRRWLRILVVN